MIIDVLVIIRNERTSKWQERMRLPSKYDRAVLLTKRSANTCEYRRKVPPSRVSDDNTPLVNLIDYECHKLRESNLQTDRAPLVNQIYYERQLKPNVTVITLQEKSCLRVS